MSKRLAKFILNYRLPILILILGLTLFMGFFACKVEIAYNFAKLLPDSDSASVDYDYFKSKFGQDGNVLVIGVEKKRISNLKNYQEWAKLGNRIKNINGIKAVVSIARLNDLKLNDSTEKFEFKPLTSILPKNQKSLDSLLKKANSLKFYEGIIFSEKNNCTLMAITFKETILNTKNRLSITDSIKLKTTDFVNATHIDVHYSGLPFFLQ